MCKDTLRAVLMRLIAAALFVFIADGRCLADYYSFVGGSGTGIKDYGSGGLGELLVSWEDTGKQEGPDWDQRLLNRSQADVGSGRVSTGLWGTTTVSANAPQSRLGPYGTARALTTDYFAIKAGESGLKDGQEVEIQFYAEVNGRVVLQGKASGSSQLDYSARLRAGSGVLAELDYSTGGLVPPEDLVVHRRVLKVVKVKIGDTLRLDTSMYNWMNGSAHEPGTCQTNYVDFSSSGIARLGYAAGFEKIEIVSEAKAPIGIPKPDLVVTDIWSESGRVYYQVMNIGEGTAVGGHRTLLKIDGVERDTDVVDVDLPPGGRFDGWFEKVVWECQQASVLEVAADLKDDIAEIREKNNSRSEQWKCDTTAPVITSGPTVSEITQTQAKITWVTDEPSGGEVLYDSVPGRYSKSEVQPQPTQNHAITLGNLTAGTVYQYKVGGADYSGNSVTSKAGYFATLAPKDTEAPKQDKTFAQKGSGSILNYMLGVSAEDNLGVDYVAFLLDGAHFMTDYSPPYESFVVPAALGMSRAEFFREHSVETVATDVGGTTMRLPWQFEPAYECEDIRAHFEYPFSDTVLYADGGAVPAGTTVPIMVYASVPEVDCSVTYVPGAPPSMRWLRTCDEVEHEVARVEVYVNTVRKCTLPGRSDHSYVCEWDAEGYPAGTHVIRVDVIAGDECKQTLIRDVTVRDGAPSLEVTREVYRTGNMFQVRLTVENRGTASYDLDRIEDHTCGFQPISGTHHHWTVKPDGWIRGKDFDVELDVFSTAGGDVITLGPGASTEVSYYAVPVLYPESEDLTNSIGSDPVELFDDDGRLADYTFDRPFLSTEGGELPGEAITEIRRASNYLVVTNPGHLFVVGDGTREEANELLSSLALLAAERNGILGYICTGYGEARLVKDLIRYWGADMSGSDGEDEHYLTNGYLLLVGEIEIVPSFIMTSTGITEASDGDVPFVRWVDNQYADMSGGDHKPELIVGRLIGNDVNVLATQVQTSLANLFDRSDAFVISGTGDGVSSFESNADDIADYLDDEFTVDQMYGSSYATDAARLAQFRARAVDKDVLFYRDHGSTNCWSHTVCENDAPYDFGTSRPFAYASACLTGEYEDWGGDGISAAEAFMASGAGAYIGATEVSLRSVNNEAGRLFFDSWVGDDESIGEVLKETKRELLNSCTFGDAFSYDDDNKLLWVLEYNLYGDPRYGAPLWAMASSPVQRSGASGEPPTSVSITIPDYVVTRRADGDYVDIPGGRYLLEDGMPRIPTYVRSLELPEGYRVQEVMLQERGGLMEEAGLELVTASTAADQNQEGEDDPTDQSGWYPQRDYSWETVENGDGTTTLLILIYPLYYNRLTTNMRFYKQYEFGIEYSSPAVEIVALGTDKVVYEQGDDVGIDFWLHNRGKSRDVFAEVTIRSEGSGEFVEGVLLRELRELTGYASCTARWDTAKAASGDYAAEVIVYDDSGVVLDRERHAFGLGVCSGEILRLTSNPEYGGVGEDVTLGMRFANTGTVNIDGMAFIRVHDANGAMLAEFTHPVEDLAPSSWVDFSDVWTLPGSELYRVVGVVVYCGQSTEPFVIEINKCGGGPLDGDISGDCYVNFEDVALIGPHWDKKCGPRVACQICDLDDDGRVGLADLALFCEQWLWCNDRADSSCESYWK